MEAEGLAIFALTFGLLFSGFIHWRGYHVMSDAATRTRREQLLGRMIQQEWKAEATSEKAKRTLTLSDDGELVEVDEYRTQLHRQFAKVAELETGYDPLHQAIPRLPGREREIVLKPEQRHTVTEVKPRMSHS